MEGSGPLASGPFASGPKSGGAARSPLAHAGPAPAGVLKMLPARITVTPAGADSALGCAGLDASDGSLDAGRCGDALAAPLLCASAGVAAWPPASLPGDSRGVRRGDSAARLLRQPASISWLSLATAGSAATAGRSPAPGMGPGLGSGLVPWSGAGTGPSASASSEASAELGGAAFAYALPLRSMGLPEGLAGSVVALLAAAAAVATAGAAFAGLCSSAARLQCGNNAVLRCFYGAVVTPRALPPLLCAAPTPAWLRTLPVLACCNASTGLTCGCWRML